MSDNKFDWIEYVVTRVLAVCVFILIAKFPELFAVSVMVGILGMFGKDVVEGIMYLINKIPRRK